ncbi:MAG: hypothetical protein M1530_02325 [Candidatus Marsarchaeota archaeon]|nr:hypothetical protein [Candidatus Marsarchaeota archaeon]
MGKTKKAKSAKKARASSFLPSSEPSMHFKILQSQLPTRQYRVMSGPSSPLAAARDWLSKRKV